MENLSKTSDPLSQLLGQTSEVAGASNGVPQHTGTATEEKP